MSKDDWRTVRRVLLQALVAALVGSFLGSLLWRMRMSDFQTGVLVGMVLSPFILGVVFALIVRHQEKKDRVDRARKAGL